MSVEDPAEERECPLCLEKLEIDDLYFFPCTCKYQVCRFCWHRIRMDENGLCPACRKPYPEDPANFQPITPMEMQQKKKQKEKEKKKNIAECRKHLAAYRVLQRNLVYVVGLSSRIADPEILRRSDYFGKYGKVIKVAVGTLPSSQGNAPVNTAYVTFSRVEDALRTIQETNSLVFDGRMIKTSLGTTKYCSNFLRGQTCNKQECMYLHEVASPELSFTKEDMHQGKHTEYEKKLLEKMNQQMEAAASTAPKENTSESERLGPFPEDEAISATPEEEQASSDEVAVGSLEKETETVSTETDSKPASSQHEDSLENDILAMDNIKIVDPIFPEELERPPRNPSPPPSGSASNYDDDLGFDPFAESMKGLEEELMKESKNQGMPIPSRVDNDPLSKLMYSMGRQPMDNHPGSSFPYGSMHNSGHSSYRFDYDQSHSNDFSSSPYGSYQNGFHNHQPSHYSRQTSQPQPPPEKTYFNSNSAFSNFFMPRHSTLPETPAYQPYRTDPPSSYNLLPNSLETRDAFKALLPNVNVSFVSPTEARGLFSTSPGQYGQQQPQHQPPSLPQSSSHFNRPMYRGTGMDFGGFQQPQMPFGSEPPGFSAASKYMTTPPPGFDHNHRQN